MTLLEKLIEEKNNIAHSLSDRKQNLVRACAGILMSATILTGCANAGEVKGSETSTTKEGTSIAEQSKSETESNYEKLIEACQKTDALGPLEFTSYVHDGGNVEYTSNIYFSKDKSAYRMIYSGSYLTSDTVNVNEDGQALEAWETTYKSGKITDDAIMYGSYPVTVEDRIKYVISQCIDYSVEYDKKLNTISLFGRHGGGYNINHVFGLNSSGVIDYYDIYEYDLQKTHYTVKQINQNQFDKIFEEYSNYANEYSSKVEMIVNR